MRTNSNITIYNKYIDASTRTEKYQRTEILQVAWENRKGSNILASGGNIAVDQATIFIPSMGRENYLAGKEWKALTSKTGYWTLQVGDVIVRGLVTDSISGATTITSLKEKYNDVLVVSSVDFMDAGSLNMHHWKVGAQ